MPVPKPRKGESKDKFISRCIEILMHRDPDRPQKQIVAICFEAWRRRKR